MGAADCEAFVKGIVGDRLTDDELEKAFENYDKLRRQFVAEGKTDNIDKRIAAAIVNQATMKKYNKTKNRQGFIQNVTKRRELNEFIGQMRAAGYSPADALKIKMEGGQSNELGIRDSVDNKKNALAGRWIGGMFAEAQNSIPTILSIIRNDTGFDNKLAQELGELSEGGTPGSSGDKIAQLFAPIVKKWSEIARLEYNSKGGQKQSVDGFVDVSHDPYKMMHRTEGKEAWVNFVYSSIDIEKTFPGVDKFNEEEIKSLLRRDFDMKVTGRFYPDISSPVPKKTPSSLIDRFSLDGTYYFKNAEAQREYQQRFGHGTFLSSIVHQMTQMARATAMMDVFGPNPEILIKQISTEQVEKLLTEMRDVTDPKELKKLQKYVRDLQVERMRGHIDEMTGTAAIPSNVSAAKLSAGMRSILSMAKLANLVTTSTVGDSMNMISNAIYGGQRGLDAFAPFLRMFDGMDSATRKSVAFRLGEGMQGFIGSVYANAIETGPMNGGMSKAMDKYFKVIGVTGMFDHSRQAFVRERSVWLGLNRDKELGDLDPFLQNGLRRNGIDENTWNAIRSADTEFVNGEHYIMPEAARTADDKHVLLIASERIKEAFHLSKVDEAKMEETKRKRLAAFEKRRQQIIDETRYDIEMKLRQYYMDETNYAIVQPNAKSRRISRGAFLHGVGTRPGDPIGEVVRSMFMYKSFSLVNWDNLRRAFENRNFLHMGVKGAGVLIRLIAFQVMAGYIIEYMKDIAKGNWPPRVPWDPELTSRALSTGGAMGIFGDYLTGFFNGYDTPAAILGPQWDFAIKAGKFFAHDIYAQKRGRAAKALRLGLDVTPFGNLMIVRPVLDTLLFDELRDWSSPGYKKRQQTKLKEKGQSNIFQEALR